MSSYLRLMRVHHSIKNVLLFLPAVFSGALFDKNTLVLCICGFLAFSLVSSSVYVINDIKDAEKDRLHPTKCNRPIAAGKITKASAVILAVSLVVVSALVSLVLCRSLTGFLILILYFLLNIGYSMGLKEIPLVDILILVSGFILRVLYGSAICGIPVSGWMYLTVMSASFYMGLGKRRNELSKNGSGTRKVLKFYTYEFLDKNMYICNALMIIFYALWCTSDGINEKFGGRMLWTIPLVIVICMKYSLNIEGNSDGDPVEVLVHDKVLALLCLVFALFVVGVIYLGAVTM